MKNTTITKFRSNILKLINSDYFIIIILFLFAFLSRYFIVNGEYHGYGWDPGNYALASKSYSILQTRPHWPGYLLHVKTIQIIDYFIKNTFKTMIVLSMIYSSLGISFFYLLLRYWFQKKEGLLISIILMTNPLVWYYGCMEEMYSFEILFSVALIFFSLKNKFIYITPILMALGAGVRPSSAVLLFPLYVFLWYSVYQKNNISTKYFILSHIAGLIFLLGWFLPLTNSVGGINSYFNMFLTHSPIQQITFFQNLIQFLIFLQYPLIGIIIGLIFLIFRKIFYKIDIGFKKFNNSDLSMKNIKWILFWWIMPPILFFVIFHYSKGTLLLCTAGLISLIPLLFWKEKIRVNFYILLIILQTSIFLLANYKLPDVQTYFNGIERNIELVEVLIERLESNYLLTKSNINIMQAEFQIIDEIIVEFKHDSSDLYSSKKYLFIDPTTTVSPRALQAQYQNIIFAKISPRMTSVYETFNSIDLKRDKPLRNMLANAVIFSRKDFVDHYLQNINIKRINYGHWTMFIPNENDLVPLENIYLKYFDRSKIN